MGKFFVIFSVLSIIASSYGKVIEHKEDNGVIVFSSNVTINAHSKDAEVFSSNVAINAHTKDSEEIPTQTIDVEEDVEEDEDEDFEVIKYFDDDDDDYVSTKNDKNVDKEIFEHGVTSYGGYKFYTSGTNCSEGCTVRFTEIGPIKYNGISTCYIYDGTAGVRDCSQYQGNKRYSMYTDINARLKCVVNGKTYYTVQRVNINTNEYFPISTTGVLDGKVSLGTELKHGSNKIFIGGIYMNVLLSDCGSVWSYRPSDSCVVAKVRISSDATCGTVNGETRFCSGNLCCSKHGYCGDSSDYCGTGCQSEFGKCGVTQKASSSSSSSSKSSGTTTDDRCGSYNGKSCHTGYCCSKYGYCGKTKDYCSVSKGCNTKFGKCTN